MARPLKIALTLAVILGAGGFLYYSSLASASDYKMVDELMVDPAPFEDRALTVHGYVEAGSIKEEIVKQSTHRRFIIERNGRRLRVEHTGPVPEAFRDLAELVAVGHLGKQGDEYVFYADLEIRGRARSHSSGWDRQGPAQAPLRLTRSNRGTPAQRGE
jgi:cytochrome c-type biogenesis protein CcmE